MKLVNVIELLVEGQDCGVIVGLDNHRNGSVLGRKFLRSKDRAADGQF